MANEELKNLVIPKEEEVVIMVTMFLIGKALELLWGEE